MFVFLAGRNATSSLTAASNDSLGLFLSQTQLLTSEFLRAETLFVCLDINKEAIRHIRNHKIPRTQSILVRNEPEVVCPENYRSTYLSKFGKVIDVGRPERPATLTTRWPQNWPKNLPEAREGVFQNRSRLVMVNADKLSFIRGEMYSLRRLCMRALPLDTFGLGWDNSFTKKFKILLGELQIVISNKRLPHLPAARGWFSGARNFKGAVSDKISTMELYRHALVIENDRTFVSEKLFDALFAGCIPVYVGADLKDLKMPPGLVFESPPTIDGLLAAFAKAKEVDFEEWAKLRDSWLEEPSTFVDNASRNVFQKISDIILESN